MKGRIASMKPRSTAGASAEAGSQSIPDFAPPYGMSRTAILWDMVRASWLTSSTVTPGRMRMPPEHIPPTRRSMTNRTNLPSRKVDDGDDQLAAEFLRAVVHRQLGAGASDAKRPEIDAKLVGRFAGLRKGLGLEDPADAHIDPLEVGDINGGRLGQHA